MYYKSKYIIIDTGTYAPPVVFSELATHADVARGLQAESVLGAGFCYISENGYNCYGESVSLKVKSRPEDSHILNKYLGVIAEDYL